MRRDVSADIPEPSASTGIFLIVVLQFPSCSVKSVSTLLYLRITNGKGPIHTSGGVYFPTVRNGKGFRAFPICRRPGAAHFAPEIFPDTPSCAATHLLGVVYEEKQPLIPSHYFLRNGEAVSSGKPPMIHREPLAQHFVASLQRSPHAR